MRILTLLVVSLALAPAVPTPARAAAPARGDAVESVLLSSTTPDTLRARLAALAAAAPAPRTVARALELRGLSFERAAMPDSAIACYRRATAVARTSLAPEALVDALLRRRGPGDVDEALAILEQSQSSEQEAGARSAHIDPALLGWAYVVSGQAKRGLEILTPLESRLAIDPAWRYRLARSYVEAGNSTKAVEYLVALNTAARGQDREVAEMLKHLDKSLGGNSRIPERTQKALQDHDAFEIEQLGRLQGRRVRLLASDGTLVGGALFADSTGKRPVPAALLLGGPGDEPGDYDSLNVALRKSGFAMFVLDPRGSGWSVAPQFSLPDTWEGRQNALSDRVARDVRDALNAFARVARIDTSRVLLIGVGSMAPVAIAAAAQDPRIGAIVLLDPWTSPVDRGATLAAARLAPVPAFIQLSVPGHVEAMFADTLFHTFPPKLSRLVESTALSSGAAAFGSRPDVTPRFVRWLGETLGAKPVKRVIPRAAPRPK